jgi:hypothetical protein
LCPQERVSHAAADQHLIESGQQVQDQAEFV